VGNHDKNGIISSKSEEFLVSWPFRFAFEAYNQHSFCTEGVILII